MYGQDLWRRVARAGYVDTSRMDNMPTLVQVVVLHLWSPFDRVRSLQLGSYSNATLRFA